MIYVQRLVNVRAGTSLNIQAYTFLLQERSNTLEKLKGSCKGSGKSLVRFCLSPRSLCKSEFPLSLDFSLREAAVTSGLLSFSSALDSDFFFFFLLVLEVGNQAGQGRGKARIQSSGETSEWNGF